jgi:hypothetical protein
MSSSAPDASVICEPRLANASTRAVTVQATGVNTPSAAGAASHKMPSTSTTEVEALQEMPSAISASSGVWARSTKTGVWMAAVLVLGMTFWLYLQPDLVIMLADHLWSCF